MPTSVEAKSALDRIKNSATYSIISKSMIGDDDGIIRPYSDDCSNCLLKVPFYEDAQTREKELSNESYQYEFNKNGVNLWSATGAFDNDEIAISRSGLRGILEYSSFSVSVDEYTLTGEAGKRFVLNRSSSGSIIRDSNPITSATYKGAMVGRVISPDDSYLLGTNSIWGDVNIEIDIDETPTADVSFSNLNGVRGAPSIKGFTDVPLDDGHFEWSGGKDSIEGYFYGPQHEEVGGHFERGNVIGAFGAKRAE